MIRDSMAKGLATRYPWTLEEPVTMNEPSLALCAEVLYQGEPLGLYHRDDIASWALQVVEREPQPPVEIIELAMSSTLCGRASDELQALSRFATALYLTGEGFGTEEEVIADLRATLHGFVQWAEGLPTSARYG
jgi:hypothetical protein